LGFAKKHSQVQEIVWATLQLPACNANLEPNQYIPEEEEGLEVKKEGSPVPTKLEPTVFSLPPIASTRDVALVGNFEAPRTAAPPTDKLFSSPNIPPPMTYTNYPDRGGNSLGAPKLKRPLPPTQQFQFHNYTQSNISQTGHQLPPRQMNYQPPPPMEPNHKAYRGNYEMNLPPPHAFVNDQDQTNSFAPHPFYKYSNIPMDQADHREQRLPNPEQLHEPRPPISVVPPPMEDSRNIHFHANPNFGPPPRHHEQTEPENLYVGAKSQIPPQILYEQRNGFTSRNSSGYLSDRLGGSRNSSGYLSDRSYESDRELERQNGFFMVMSDDIVSPNPDYYYYGSGSLEFSEFPASLGHDLPSIQDINNNTNTPLKKT
jgi:hypothetical protein